MSKRGLSMEEKKTKMLEIFHGSAEFYSLKELEKIAPKSKGIVVQSVKEVLDDLKNATLAKATKELEKINAGISETQAGLVEAEKGREATEERRTLLATLQQEEQISIELKAELAAFGAADPVRYQKKSEAVKVCKDAAVRWTGVESAAIRGMLGITEEWEDFKL
ncbi:hypothetical protein LQV05_001612 [Cryptococcus neoformans]|nr:hypothetical protein LQV05_001612 [Cryptococcus neoformans]